MQTKPTIADYSIEPPAFPVGGYVLGGVVGVGLVALFMAAQHAFGLVATSEWHAFFNAALIETSAIVEALTLARARKREDYVLAGVATAFSLAVSGIYNYVQVAAQGLKSGVTDPVQIWALALGPLVALGFLSLNFGRALRAHEDEKKLWETNRQKWLDEKVTEWEKMEREAKEKRETREAEERERNAQREERRQKREEKRNAAGTATPAPSTSGSANGTAADATETTNGTDKKRFGSKAEFLKFMEIANGDAPKNAEELKRNHEVPHTTAYRWWKAWEEQKDVQPVVEN